MNYRNKTTGTISTQGELRRANAHRSFPRVWDADVCTLLDIDPILASPKPTVTNLQQVNTNGTVQDALGNWVESWVVADKFSDTTDDGVTILKAAHETAYTAKLDADAAKSARTERDQLITETDYYALSDVTMSTEMSTYRQALRDITAQAGFPSSITWPTKP